MSAVVASDPGMGQPRTTLVEHLQAQRSAFRDRLAPEEADRIIAARPFTQGMLRVLHSLAGRCYADSRSLIVGNAKSSPDHYEKADNVSGYRTQDTLNVPLPGRLRPQRATFRWRRRCRAW